MKIRNGFVSNSSSCSFIAVGYIVNTDQYDKKTILKKLGCSDEKIAEYENDLYELFYNIAEEQGIEIKYNGDDGYDGDKNNTIFVCHTLARGDECNEFGNDIFSFIELKDKVKPIKEKLNLDQEPVLLFGTECC